METDNHLENVFSLRVRSKQRWLYVEESCIFLSEVGIVFLFISYIDLLSSTESISILWAYLPVLEGFNIITVNIE